MKKRLSKAWKERTISNIVVLAVGIVLALFLINFSYFRGVFHTIWRILSPFVMGFVIAYLLVAPLKWLERLARKVFCRKRDHPHLCRVVAIVVTYILLLLLLVAFFSFVMPQFAGSIARLISQLPEYFEALVQKINSLIVEYDIPQSVVDRFLLSEEKQDELVAKLVDTLTALLPHLISFSKQLSSGIINLFVGFIVSVYMLFHRERFAAQGKKMAYALMPRNYVRNLIFWLRKSHHIFGGFLYGKILDSFIIGVICYLFMIIVGMEYAVLISVIVGVTNMIPFFGPFIGAIPSTFILLMVNPISAFWFVIWIIVLQQFDGNILGPRILGNSTGISGFWVLLAITLGGGLFGISGMILGVPLFAVFYAVVKSLVGMRLQRLGLPAETEEYAVNPELAVTGPLEQALEEHENAKKAGLRSRRWFRRNRSAGDDGAAGKPGASEATDFDSGQTDVSNEQEIGEANPPESSDDQSDPPKKI